MANVKNQNLIWGVSGWAWLFSGAVLGLFAAFLVFLSRIPAANEQNLMNGFLSAQGLTNTTKNSSSGFALLNPSEEATTNKEADGQTDQGFSYSFFTKLLEPSETRETKPQAKEIQDLTHTAVANQSKGYVLQVGSFRNIKDAKRQRVSLILEGFTPEIEPITIDTTPWHRVVLGPFENKTDATQAAKRVQSLGKETLIYYR